MTKNNEQPGPEEGPRGLGELTEENEHRAIETLIEGTIQSPSVVRGDSIDSIFSCLVLPLVDDSLRASYGNIPSD
jgi:hypothetical protein